MGRPRAPAGNAQHNSAHDQHGADDWRHTFALASLYSMFASPALMPCVSAREIGTISDAIPSAIMSKPANSSVFIARDVSHSAQYLDGK